MDELLDIVNKNDEVVGNKLRSEIYLEKDFNFRVVNAFLINDENKLWIPRRSKNKKLFPLYLDCSMGGHVISGESYLDAFFRELNEELNIDANKIKYEMIKYLNPYEHSTSAFMNVYIIKTNDVPNYNKNDFIEYFWLTPDELLNKLQNGDNGKSDLSIIIKNIFI